MTNTMITPSLLKVHRILAGFEANTVETALRWRSGSLRNVESGRNFNLDPEHVALASKLAELSERAEELAAIRCENPRESDSEVLFLYPGPDAFERFDRDLFWSLERNELHTVMVACVYRYYIRNGGSPTVGELLPSKYDAWCQHNDRSDCDLSRLHWWRAWSKNYRVEAEEETES